MKPNPQAAAIIRLAWIVTLLVQHGMVERDAYTARCSLSVRTWWRDLGRLRDAGWRLEPTYVQAGFGRKGVPHGVRVIKFDAERAA